MPLLDDKTRILLKLFVPQRRVPNTQYAVPEMDKDLLGKTIVFTGGTDGIGQVAVEMLYEMGANIVLLSRNPEKANAQIQSLHVSPSAGNITLEICDLASMDSVKACAERILANHTKIDILVNNAGINMTKPVVTSDGFETNWAINYFGPRLLTELLLERIKASAPARIVNLTTNTEFIANIDFDDIQSRANFVSDNSYVESKLSMNMFTIDLANELANIEVTVNSLCPGHIRSNLLNHLEGTEKIMKYVMHYAASPTVVGADRIVRLAISSHFNNASGIYVCEDKIKSHHSEAQNAIKRAQARKMTKIALAPWLNG
ncbi:SDR family NAD(P)-dependent oxidoreductase [Vibrio ulleungensis]|uniref:SDR family NAD(P)-dependent oxidoreductase n=1 Tax=Vibrio ulleungensis TaxID=2807619 RepID=A0ABS2HHH3_9VIBR|nr:SDR family NAD(P)-dependent oxidoreductase [Vibrio ulleungensis]MBM7035277.1 SDR family NAD(P)-dependent oxidoreductase [Vibrio ulleungensis]